MGKKSKLQKKLNKLDKKLHENNKYVSREEFLKSKLSKRLKEYLKTLTPERQTRFLKYIIKQEDWETSQSLNYFEKNDPVDEHNGLSSKKARTLYELNKDIDNTRKNKKREKKLNKKKNVLKGKNGLKYLLNPEAHDQVRLDTKEYRKFLSKLVEQEKKGPIEIDVTMDNFKRELMSNSNVNQAVMESFWNKHGY